MKALHAAAAAALACSFVAPVAQADPKDPKVTPRDGTAGADREAPPPATGFQLTLRTGPMIPVGQAAKNQAMADTYGWQVPLVVEIGGKIMPEMFIGAYGGAGLGRAGGKSCDQVGATCTTTSLRVGLAVQLHLMPAEKLDPWFGYGIGFESVTASGSANGKTVSQALSGPEYAHFSAGLDFRLSNTLGIGPMADFSIGQYTRATTETGSVKVEGDIDDKLRALHYWLFVGGRMVFFP
jgi:hypothetical protein